MRLLRAGRAATWTGALSIAGVLAASCSSPCVDMGQRILVDVIASPQLNDTGSGPQHVRFVVWAVKDRQAFEGESAASLSDPVAAERLGSVGKPLSTDSYFIKPGATRKLSVRVELEAEFTHVGIAVDYAQPKSLLVAADCGAHAGYAVEEAEGKKQHHVVFNLEKASITAGSGN